MDTFGRRLTISCGELRSNSNESTADDELSAAEGSLEVHDPVVAIEAATAAEAPSQSESGDDAIDDMPDDDDVELEPGDLSCRSELALVR